MIKKYDLKIFCLQEPCLTCDRFVNKFPNFNVIASKNSINDKKAGSVMLIHKSLKIINIIDFDVENEFKSDFETSCCNPLNICGVNIEFNSKIICLISAYANCKCASLSIRYLKYMISKSPHTMYVFGDFNARHKSWNNGPHNAYGALLYDFLLETCFRILNNDKEYTWIYRVDNSQRGSKLDLCISNDMLDRNFKFEYVVHIP